jgi:hypothetical protein
MRLSIFVGLLYVAWCINPTVFDTAGEKPADIFIVGLVFWLALWGDLKDLLYKEKK